MERWVGRVALVTGASVGIGEAITRSLVRHGMIVVACARGVDKIQAMKLELEAESACGKLHPIQCDLTQKDQIAAMFKEIKKEYKVVHVCINNAGISFEAGLIKSNPEDWQMVLDVNIMALCICTQESIKLMLENKVNDGQIIHLNSMSGHRVVGESFYCGTKYMVTALTEGLRNELRAMKTNIRVCGISPGIVETEFAFRKLHQDPAECTFYQENPGLKAEDVANQVIHILQQPAHVQLHDILMRATEQVL
ncbi:dehydrogenase/reductase SDR family member 11 [Strongylocentrotus purpuratus]|uniref:Dehydrogenase/reductase SDR family member 11 n=1 Tax=Strongylocentrotus purpuratus TaxID=7668 RepID=A0A7M7RB07_STRPU|nr:dehydrogenase/reductase SDR family member 11 [Strongylocentrotus purpuratus]XP_780068.3 dehydrogenase/reductase SDR family member 11 [Strongylocentrotus purpuratus]|eukprot:XP_011679965.1 PREDICTED: dehydrogenase/reductase SDR family member 11 [Strongylocentrotus purpuratus]